MNILQIVNAAIAESGAGNPLATLINNRTAMALQLEALANREVASLVSARDWTGLSREWIINTAQPISGYGDLTEGSNTITNLFLPNGGNVLGTIAQGNGLLTQGRVLALSLDGHTASMSEQATATLSQTPITFQTDTYALADDFKRYVSSTMWDRTNIWQLQGPLNPQEYAAYTSGLYVTFPAIKWRQIGQYVITNGLDGNTIVTPNTFRIIPPANTTIAGHTLSFEYVSKNAVITQQGTTSYAFTADTDTTFFDPQLLILGIKYRLLAAKGMNDTAQAAGQEYSFYRDTEMARDGGNRPLSVTRGTGYYTPIAIPQATGYVVP